jgi:hypothetical protein
MKIQNQADLFFSSIFLKKPMGITRVTINLYPPNRLPTLKKSVHKEPDSLEAFHLG